MEASAPVPTAARKAHATAECTHTSAKNRSYERLKAVAEKAAAETTPYIHTRRYHVDIQKLPAYTHAERRPAQTYRNTHVYVKLLVVTEEGTG